MHLNYIQSILSIFDLYWSIKIFTLYSKCIKHIFDHIMEYWIENKRKNCMVHLKIYLLYLSMIKLW